MKLETPILTYRKHCYYVERKAGWVCRTELLNLFETSPRRISLAASSEYIRGAYKVEIRLNGGEAQWRLVGSKKWKQLLKQMDSYVSQFLDAGHSIVYITLYSYG